VVDVAGYYDLVVTWLQTPYEQTWYRFSAGPPPPPPVDPTDPPVEPEEPEVPEDIDEEFANAIWECSNDPDDLGKFQAAFEQVAAEAAEQNKPILPEGIPNMPFVQDGEARLIALLDGVCAECYAAIVEIVNDRGGSATIFHFGEQCQDVADAAQWVLDNKYAEPDVSMAPLESQIELAWCLALAA
jgi:hypothetical protein